MFQLGHVERREIQLSNSMLEPWFIVFREHIPLFAKIKKRPARARVRD